MDNLPVVDPSKITHLADWVSGSGVRNVQALHLARCKDHGTCTEYGGLYLVVVRHKKDPNLYLVAAGEYDITQARFKRCIKQVLA